MSKIPARMIEIDTGDRVVSLENILLHSESVPIEMWGKSTSTNVEKAIDYLKSVGGGSLKVPANDKYNMLVVRVMWGKNRNIQTPDMVVRYEYSNWRPPNTVKDSENNVVGEYRPYTNDPWKIGDIIHNSDMEHSDDKVTEWYCTESGTDEDPAGSWRYVDATIPAGQRTFSYNAEEEKLTLW